MNKIKAIIFDLDDTLVNSLKIHTKAWDILFEHHKIDYDRIPDNLRKQFLGMRIIDILKVLKEELNLKQDIEQLFNEREKIFINLFKNHVEPLDGAQESVRFFKYRGYKMALASSGTHDYIEIAIKKMGLLEEFDVIVGGEDVQKGKPDPQTYIKAAQKLNLKPNQCLVIEDAQKGVRSAKSAGCFCIGVENIHTPKQNLSSADEVVMSLRQIDLETIEKLEHPK